MELGNKVKDVVTGFTGIAVAKVEYLNGCVQFCVKGSSDGKSMPDGHYIDIGQLKFVSKGVAVKKKDTGGVMSDSPSKKNGGML